jgi:tetratricopeptide (TPR) repeat protein
MFGGYIGGEPRIVIQEQNAAIGAYKQKDYSKALVHSKKAIEAYEATKKIQHGASTNDFVPDFLSKMYFLGSIVASLDKKYETALGWIKEADLANPSPEQKAYQAAILYDMGKPEEARPLLEEALKASPDNPFILDIQRRSIIATGR